MVSKSIGLCMMTLMAPFSWARGITMFSRASDSGTSSTTDGGDLDLAELDEVHAELLGLGLHDLVRVGVAELDQRLFERDVAHPLGFLELVGADDPALDQDVGPVAALLRHGKMCSGNRLDAESGTGRSSARRATARPRGALDLRGYSEGSRSARKTGGSANGTRGRGRWRMTDRCTRATDLNSTATRCRQAADPTIAASRRGHRSTTGSSRQRERTDDRLRSEWLGRMPR